MGQIKHYNNGTWTIYTSGESLSGYTGITGTYYVGADLTNNGNFSKANPNGTLADIEKQLPTNVGNLVINDDGEPQSTLIREYYDGDLVIYPLTEINNTTTEVAIGSVFIPANTFKVGDVTIKGIVSVSYGASIGSTKGDFKFYSNTTNSLNGATLINTLSNAIGGTVYAIQSSGYNAAAPDQVDFAKFISNTSLVGGTLNFGTNPATYNSSYTTFDITQDAYVIVTITLKDIGDRFALKSIFLNKTIKPISLI